MTSPVDKLENLFDYNINLYDLLFLLPKLFVERVTTDTAKFAVTVITRNATSELTPLVLSRVAFYFNFLTFPFLPFNVKQYFLERN